MVESGLGTAASEFLAVAAGKAGMSAEQIARLDASAASLERMAAKLEAMGGKSATASAGTTSAGTFAQLATKADEAVFWSGLGSNGKAIAAEVAAKNNGSTLEQVLRRTGTKLPPYDPTNDASVTAWRQASEALAANAKGNVKVVLGSDLRPDSIWNTIESSALKSNPNMTSIVQIDAKTGARTVIYKR